MAYGTMRVGNPKEQDPFSIPSFFIFHIYDKNAGRVKMRGKL
jgi:hypothetical protein